MPRPPPYPTVPQTSLTGLSWRIPSAGTIRLERGTPQLLRRVDTEWRGVPHAADDESMHWEFHVLGQGVPERFVVVDDGERIVAAWLDHTDLVCGDAYRLDFIKVRPDVARRGVGRATLALIGKRARECGASRIVFQPLTASYAFYVAPKIGATPCPDWKGPESLPNLQIGPKALTQLERFLDELQLHE